MIRLFSPTGANTKPKPAACTAGPPSTAVSATAPLGGCRQRSRNITAIEKKIAADAAATGSSISFAQLTPINPATRLPPTIDQGCASGLAGTANSSTADAPIGATSQAAAALA